MKQRRINATLIIAALTLTALLILTTLPQAGTAASRLERQPLESLTALNSTDATESGAPLSAFSVPSVASVVQPSGATTRVSAALHSSPVMFIENVGQFDERARFQVRGGIGTMWLAEDAIWITIVEPSQTDPLESSDVEREDEPIRGVNLRLTFPGANPHPRIEPLDHLDTVVSYFIGNDPDQWHPDVPVWGGVRYVDLYPGIDLELIGEGGQWQTRIVARPSADLRAVRLRVEGVDAVTLNGDRLRLTTAVGGFSLPLLTIEDLSVEDANVELADDQTFEVTFPFSSARLLPSSSAALLQDNPDDLLYSTFLGGNGRDNGFDIAVDASGAAYVTGWTSSSDYPTTSGAFDTTLNGADVFVTKLNASGSALVYSTFLGGRSRDESYSIAVDASGAAYVTGMTNSSDYPTTAGAFDTTYNGRWWDAFVTKLNAAGSALVYSTFLGGEGIEKGLSIAVDGNETACVTGYTSSGYPTTAGAFDTTFNGGYEDAFVTKLNAAGSALVYSTFLGGGDNDEGRGVAVDGSGAVYVTGWTHSSDYPTTAGAFDTTYDNGDVFVTKLDASGNALVYSTFLGGSSQDGGSDIAVDVSREAYIGGWTSSPDYPTTSGAFDTTYGNGDAFVTKLNAAGSALVYSTFLGGSDSDLGYDIAVDESGAAYISGLTPSSDYPTTAGAFDVTLNGGRDIFVTKLDAAGSAMVYSTHLGGSSYYDVGGSIAVDASGAAYVGGWTQSSDYPTTTGAFDTTFNEGKYDAFVTKLAVGGGGAPTPFLDLPFEYTNFGQATLANIGGQGPGRVNAWFDHTYPNGRNYNLALWNGRIYTGAEQTYDDCLSYGTCYDGHNGIDFSYADPQPNEPGDQPLPIRPAAGGAISETVTACTDSCRYGSCSACGAYGNYVIVNHRNHYFTRYAHLREVSVSEGQSVTTDDTLGIMGATGYVEGRGDGTHLHLSVYYDDNDDGTWSENEVVDPFHWRGSPPEPWEANGGPTSYYLWIHQVSTQDPVSGDQGATMTDTTGHIQAIIPPGAFSGQAILELSPVPEAEPSAQLRSSGHSFWLRLLEWLLGGGGLQSATTLQSTTQLTLTKPITLTVTYTDTDVLHLDVPQLALHRWDEEQEMWQPLTTTVDSDNHVVTAQTEDLGDFDLQAPLLCTTDDLESDDGYPAARWVWPNDWPLARGLDIPQDSDWSRFDAVQGVTYTISTQNLAAGADTVLHLYDVDALTLLASNDDADGGPASELGWTAPYTGTFFIETVSAPGGTTDCSATYELTIATIPGDVIADCQVDISDIMQVASRWRLNATNPDPDNDPTTPNYETLFDLDGDGIITVVDIMKVVAHWGETCE